MRSNTTFQTTLLNTAKSVKAHINGCLNSVYLKNRPASGFSEHKYLYLIRYLVFPSHVEDKAADCIRGQLNSRKIKFVPNNVEHRIMVKNKQIEYQFDAHWFPDSWLIFLWLGSPDVQIDRCLEMFCTEAKSRKIKLITQPHYVNKLGSSDRIASSISSRNTTPDDQNKKYRGSSQVS